MSDKAMQVLEAIEGRLKALDLADRGLVEARQPGVSTVVHLDAKAAWTSASVSLKQHAPADLALLARLVRGEAASPCVVVSLVNAGVIPNSTVIDELLHVAMCSRCRIRRELSREGVKA